MLLIRGKERKKNKSNVGVPVFGYISASGRDCRNGEMNESHNIGSLTPQTPQAQTMSPLAVNCPTLVGRTKNKCLFTAFRQKKNLLYFLFLLDFVNSFRDCLYTTCFVWLDASGLLVLSVCSLQL